MTASIGSSLLERHRDMQCALKLFALGARVQVVESVTQLSRSWLLKLYSEINQKPAPKGQLPSSSGWFCQHEANIHSSLFWNIRLQLDKYSTGLRGGEVLCKAYEAYLSEIALHSESLNNLTTGEPIFTVTRAWMLDRFMRIGELAMTECTSCTGGFIYSPLEAPELRHTFVCSLCRPPSRMRT